MIYSTMDTPRNNLILILQIIIFYFIKIPSDNYWSKILAVHVIRFWRSLLHVFLSLGEFGELLEVHCNI